MFLAVSAPRVRFRKILYAGDWHAYILGKLVCGKMKRFHEFLTKELTHFWYFDSVHVFLLLVIIDNVNVFIVLAIVNWSEGNSPLIVDADAPEPFPIPPKLFQAVCRNCL